MRPRRSPKGSALPVGMAFTAKRPTRLSSLSASESASPGKDVGLASRQNGADSVRGISQSNLGAFTARLGIDFAHYTLQTRHLDNHRGDEIALAKRTGSVRWWQRRCQMHPSAWQFGGQVTQTFDLVEHGAKLLVEGQCPQPFRERIECASTVLPIEVGSVGIAAPRSPLRSPRARNRGQRGVPSWQW